MKKKKNKKKELKPYMTYIIEEMDLNIKIIYLEEYYKNGKKMQ